MFQHFNSSQWDFLSKHERVFHGHPQQDVNGTDKNGAVRMQSAMHLYNVNDLLFGLSALSNIDADRVQDRMIEGVRARVYTDMISMSEDAFKRQINADSQNYSRILLDSGLCKTRGTPRSLGYHMGGGPDWKLMRDTANRVFKRATSEGATVKIGINPAPHLFVTVSKIIGDMRRENDAAWQEKFKTFMKKNSGTLLLMSLGFRVFDRSYLTRLQGLLSDQEHEALSMNVPSSVLEAQPDKCLVAACIAIDED